MWSHEKRCRTSCLGQKLLLKIFKAQSSLFWSRFISHRRVCILKYANKRVFGLNPASLCPNRFTSPSHLQLRSEIRGSSTPPAEVPLKLRLPLLVTPVPYTHCVPPAASPTSGIQNKPLTQTTAQEEAEPLQALVAKESVSQQHFRAKPRLLNLHPCVGRQSW